MEGLLLILIGVRAGMEGLLLILIGVVCWLSWRQRNAFFRKFVSFRRKILFLPAKYDSMKKGKLVLLSMLALLLLFGSCASSGSSAMRKAERQMERMEKRSAKEFDKAKASHYKHQSKKTKRMMNQDRRRAERMRRHQRSNPYFWRLSSGGDSHLVWRQIHWLG